MTSTRSEKDAKAKMAATKQSKATTAEQPIVRLRAYRRMKVSRLAPRALYQANPLERIELARSGVKASQVGTTAILLRVPKESLVKTLGFSKATVARKVNKDSTLDLEQSSRLIGILSLVGQIEDAMDDAAGSDAPDFDAGAWVSNWLEQPMPALGHRKPSAFMDSSEGQMLVSQILAQSLAGAYV